MTSRRDRIATRDRGGSDARCYAQFRADSSASSYEQKAEKENDGAGTGGSLIRRCVCVHEKRVRACVCVRKRGAACVLSH